MLNGPSDHPVQLEARQKNPKHFIVPFNLNSKWRTPALMLEDLLAAHGRMVARYPWAYIVGCLLLTLISSFGLFAFRWENNIVRYDFELFQEVVFHQNKKPPLTNTDY